MKSEEQIILKTFIYKVEFRSLILISFLLAFLQANGQICTIDHNIWTKELKRFVTDEGVVDYYQWSMDRKGLDDYILVLSKNPVAEEWTKNEQLAYWINAYNAFTIKLVLTHFPVESIRDINRGEPWKEIWFRLGNATYSLDKIEHEVIRPQFNDPRIHFALNCAARSCPPLLNEAYDPLKLEEQLSKRTRLFINNKKFNELATSFVRLSPIFEWYKEDFGDLISFLNTYATTSIRPDVRIEYQYYDWKLNEN